ICPTRGRCAVFTAVTLARGSGVAPLIVERYCPADSSARNAILVAAVLLFASSTARPMAGRMRAFHSAAVALISVMGLSAFSSDCACFACARLAAASSRRLNSSLIVASLRLGILPPELPPSALARQTIGSGTRPKRFISRAKSPHDSARVALTERIRRDREQRQKFRLRVGRYNADGVWIPASRSPQLRLVAGF